MSNTNLIKDARGRLAELKEFGGDFDEWEQLAYLTEPMADALEAAESTTTVEWGVRADVNGTVCYWGATNHLAMADPKDYPGFTIVSRAVGPWIAVQP